MRIGPAVLPVLVAGALVTGLLDILQAVRLRGGSSARLNAARPNGVNAYLEMNGLDVWKFAAQYQPVAMRRATLRATAPSWRSSWRTPLSRG